MSSSNLTRVVGEKGVGNLTFLGLTFCEDGTPLLTSLPPPTLPGARCSFPTACGMFAAPQGSLNRQMSLDIAKVNYFEYIDVLIFNFIQ